ncbi:MAG: ROK family protein [Bacteroidales bacterium]|nr:ROK family protein [Bacteroidales bacterium]
MRRYTIGIDIGGTNTDIGLVSETGQCVKRTNLSTKSYVDVNQYVEDIAEEIENMAASFPGDELLGIGIGAPNAHFYSGTIDNAPNLPFKGKIFLRDMLQNRLHLPVVLTNDANAAAYGELIYGGGRGMKDFIMLTLGTGVGSGLVVNGKVVYGHDGFAGELGHIILYPNGRQCSCGRRGCLEEYASVRGIIQNFWELAETGQYDSVLLTLPKKEVGCRKIGDAAAAGDALAVATVNRTGYFLGIALANAVAFSSPEAIFLMGGPTHLHGLLEAIKTSFEEHLLNSYKGKIEIRFSELADNEVAILGAAAMAIAENNIL